MNESIIHEIYIKGNEYNYIILFPQIFYSFVISHILYLVIKYNFLPEKKIVEIKDEANCEKANDKSEDIKRCFVIKYNCFYIIGFLFLIFCWYSLSSFGAVYQNTQQYLIKNTLTSIALSFIYPFIINIIPGIFRIAVLREPNKNKSCMYKISKAIQLI